MPAPSSSSSDESSDESSSESSDDRKKRKRKRHDSKREKKKKKKKDGKVCVHPRSWAGAGSRSFCAHAAQEKRSKRVKDGVVRKNKDKKKKRSKEEKKEVEAELSLLPSVHGGVAEPLPPSVYGGVADEVSVPPPKRTVGMQSPDEAAAAFELSQRVHRIWDEQLGVSRCVGAPACTRDICVHPSLRGVRAQPIILRLHAYTRRRSASPRALRVAVRAPARPHRLVKQSGEVIEESVSREEQRRLMAAKAAHVQSIGPSGPTRAVQGPPAAPTAGASFTGREKFPSQHQWFGYK